MAPNNPPLLTADEGRGQCGSRQCEANTTKGEITMTDREPTESPLEIPKAFDGMGNEIERAERALGTLCDKLAPIMRPEDPVTVDKSVELSPVELVNSIDQLTYRIEQMRMQLEHVIDRLAL